MSTPKIALDAWTWAQECSRRAGAAGIRFVWDAHVDAPCTDGRTVRIPPLPVDAAPDDFTILRGSVIHECGHILRPQAFTILERERLKTGSPLWACMNITEDAAQERAVAEKWRGDRMSLAESHGAILRRQIANAAKPLPPGARIDPDTCKLIAAMGCSLLSGADWSEDMRTGAELYVRALDRTVAPGAAALFGDLCAEGWPARIATAGNPEGAWTVARALYARLFPGKPEEENKEPPESGGAGPGSKGESGDQPAPAGEPAPGVIPWQLIFHSDHEQEALGAPCPSRVDWNGKTSDGAPQFFPEQKVERAPATASAYATAARDPFPAALVNDVRRMLQAQTRVRWDHERLDGRLDRRNLTRVIMPRVGDGTFNRSIFQRRAPSMVLDCAITVLIDSSGSMHGAKFTAAASAAMCLNDLCEVSLRVPSEILGFTDDGRLPLYFEFKTFSERRADRLKVGARIHAINAAGRMRGNPDGDALLWAASRLKPRREARKILIVLSDGSPSDAVPGGDPDSSLKAAIKMLRSSGGVEVYGIGVMDDNVQRYYSPTAPVINSPAEVPAALVNVLADVIQRGGRR